ncbi:substrate-binding domain-containing protein [Lentisphaera profundi]|uniref:Substrate-binding domain-containing protein n=1 Tax=Lentisphaera profundi TaxID=1658616 RepID=A0ABY7VTS4_9BACT|nr:substrate-binding domain-containing protein [Lentisphaera profundi]WDE95533.1 substrate-binding domain-containing protein [Lentisphaera profundi]
MAKKRIALAFPMGSSHLEKTAYGIRQYCNSESDKWKLITNPETHILKLSDIQQNSVDGIIAMLRNQEDLDWASKLSTPIINISGTLTHSIHPRVCPDFFSMGKLAADHFFERGFTNFAFFGLSSTHFSKQMFMGYKQQIEQRNQAIDCLEVPFGADFFNNDEQVLQFLKDLPLPCAILAAHDPRAQMLIQACEELNLKVPEDIAILGSNNDTVSCEFSSPPLSSIERDDQKIGFEAAKALDMLMRGEACQQDLLIQPLGIQERKSTEIFTPKHPEIKIALDFIEQQFTQSLNVQMICDHLGRSRRWLEYAFREELQQSPKHFINERRLKKALHLLESSPSFNLSQVAHSSGFSNIDQMNQLFIKKHGKRAIFFKN